MPLFPRYTEVPLPAHRFLPGDREPACIPELPEPPTLRPADRWRTCTAYLYGCDLYNHGFWWEAHEVWESLWRLAAEESKHRAQHQFIQGLIQTSACAIKLEQRKARGLVRLLSSSERYLRAVEQHAHQRRFMGVRIQPWRESAQRYYGKRLRGEQIIAGHDRRSFPYLRLRDRE